MNTHSPLLIVLALSATMPLAAGSVILDPQPVCVFDPTMWDTAVGNACADVDFGPLCVTVWATVYSQHVYADVATPEANVQTKPIDVGPVHVSPVLVTVDSVHVVTVDEWTPQRGFNNKFCTTSLLA